MTFLLRISTIIGMSRLINRPAYLAKLHGFKNMQLVKAVTGVRRCGKSTLFKLFQADLKRNGISSEQIIEINLEDADYVHLLGWKNLHDHIKQRLLPGKMNYIFLDEIQQVENFPKTINSLRILDNVDLYVTGSNAYMFSGKIMTLLGGRYVEIRMLPLSFAEYMQAFPEADPSRKYKDYLEQSSFPQTLEFHGNKQLIHDYLDGLYNTIVRRDVLLRKGMKDSSQFENIARFLFDNIGCETSTKKIADSMTSAGRKISVHTVESYISALTDSYILYRAGRFDIKRKQYLKTGHKYYIVDPGLRCFLLGSQIGDEGRVLENVVFLELCRRGYEVSFGKIDNVEVDFVAIKGGAPVYFQIAMTTRDQSTMERELRPLNNIHDHYPKFLITMDDDPPAVYNGIHRINVLDWLLED